MRRPFATLRALCRCLPLPGLASATLLVATLAYASLGSDGWSRALVSNVAQAQALWCDLAQPAFCETFDQPAGTGNRSGQLNGTLWGVSRAIGGSGNNLGQQEFNAWSPTQLQTCSGTTTVQPDNDIIICNGQVREALNDNEDVITLAMYPKQPFDFAGRTGIVTFDVSNDTQGTHTQWPEFWVTDQPVPAPFTHLGSWLAAPRNGLGLRFAAATTPGQGHNIASACPDDQFNRWSVDSAVVSRNYVIDDEADNGAIRVQMLDCVIGSSGPGNMNHVELHISQSQIDVYATDAGTMAPLKHIAVVPNANLTFTRGLIWLEDVHYNAAKFGGQTQHTFAWDNVGFDGPVLPRDLSFDVQDALAPVAGYPGKLNLGFFAPPGAGPQLSVPNVSGVPNAAAALLTFNFFHYDAPQTLNYSVNGHAHSVAWPYPDRSFLSWRTLGASVPVSDLVTGTNMVSISSDQPIALANVNIILVAAGGVVGVSGSPPPPSFTQTATPSSSTPTSTATSVIPPTATTPPVTPTPTAGSAGASTPTPTATPLPPAPSAPSAPAPPASGGGGGSAGSGGGGGSAGSGGGSTSSAGAGNAFVPAASFAPISESASQSSAPQAAAPAHANGPKPPQPDVSAIPSQPAPTLTNATVDANGGELSVDQVSLTVPSNSVGGSGAQLSLLPIDPQAVPTPAAGFQLGSSAFVLTLTDTSTGSQLSPSNPLTLEYRLSSDEINRAGGDLSRLKVASWVDNSWVALDCTSNAGDLECTIPHLSLFALVVAPPPSGELDAPSANGWFYKEANGFNGAGEAGFAVVDDADASLWSEFQRLGGVDRLGYPMSKRFEYGGYPTQAFQRVVLQWRPDLESAVAVSIFDDLSARGSDAWLDATRQVPRPSDTLLDAGLTGDELVASQIAMLDQYAALHDFYTSDPMAMTLYGLPLSIKDYGPVVSVRLQHATLQMWTSDTPWAAAETVIVVNSGDIAKDAGLWSPSVLAPTPPSLIPAQAENAGG